MIARGLVIVAFLLAGCPRPDPWRSSADACPNTDGPTECCDPDSGMCSDVPLSWDECRTGLPDGTPCTVQIGPSSSCVDHLGTCTRRWCEGGVCRDHATAMRCVRNEDCEAVGVAP